MTVKWTCLLIDCAPTFLHIRAIIVFRLFLRCFLSSSKNTVNIYANFCSTQNISQIFAIAIDFFGLFLVCFCDNFCGIFRLSKRYRKFLGFAKYFTNICGIFYAVQKIAPKDAYFLHFFALCKIYHKYLHFCRTPTGGSHPEEAKSSLLLLLV